MSFPFRVAIVGCGHIAKAYADQISTYPEVALVGFQDLDPTRAVKFADDYGKRAYTTLEEVLADDSIDAIVNLTIHHAHVEVITKALKAGKHVHSEKPIAMTYADAKGLVHLAEERGMLLSSAPVTWMGEGGQTLWKALRAEEIGQVRLVYSEVNHSRIETWHPNSMPFFEVGVMFDVGVYPITMITAFLGPVVKVQAMERFLYRERVDLNGKHLTLPTPDFAVALLETASGVLIRLTSNFYADTAHQGSALEFIGDNGTLWLGNFQGFSAGVERKLRGEKVFTPLPHLQEPFQGIEFARGVRDLAEAVRTGRPPRATGAHAAHVVEIIEAMHLSAEKGHAVSVSSTFPPSVPMPWAE